MRASLLASAVAYTPLAVAANSRIKKGADLSAPQPTDKLNSPDTVYRGAGRLLTGAAQ